MNLAGRKDGGRLPAHMTRIRRSTVRQSSRGDRFTESRQVRRSHVVMQRPKCRRNRGGVKVLGAIGKTDSLRLGKSRREFRERLQERASHGVSGNEASDLLRNLPEHQLPRSVTSLHSFLKDRNILHYSFLQR